MVFKAWFEEGGEGGEVRGKISAVVPVCILLSRSCLLTSFLRGSHVGDRGGCQSENGCRGEGGRGRGAKRRAEGFLS